MESTSLAAATSEHAFGGADAATEEVLVAVVLAVGTVDRGWAALCDVQATRTHTRPTAATAEQPATHHRRVIPAR
jgi:hypothetical protein